MSDGGLGLVTGSGLIGWPVLAQPPHTPSLGGGGAGWVAGRLDGSLPLAHTEKLISASDPLNCGVFAPLTAKPILPPPPLTLSDTLNVRLGLDCSPQTMLII